MTHHRIETPTLSVGCFLSGPEDGAPLMLLHGWPDDALTWDAMLPALHRAGYRTIAPFLRGFGPTRFRDPGTMRSGEIAALTQDVLELSDALGLQRFAIVGHDWGARIAYSAACLQPDRIAAIAALSVGWNGNDPDAAVSLPQRQAYWYQWLMATERGAAMVEHERRDYTRHIWDIWNPGWAVADEMFERTARSFENPDWAAVTLHSYRVRWRFAAQNPDYAQLAQRIQDDPVVQVPALMIQGGADPCALPDSSENKQHLFSDRYDRVVLDGIGHFPQRQDPERVLGVLLPFLDESYQR